VEGSGTIGPDSPSTEKATTTKKPSEDVSKLFASRRSDGNSTADDDYPHETTGGASSSSSGETQELKKHLPNNLIGISENSGGVVDFDESILNPDEPLGVALLNSVQTWYVVSLVLASFFVVSVIVNVMLCCAFRKRFSRRRSNLVFGSSKISTLRGSPSGSSSSGKP
jgi:hypothetical protein